MDARDRHNEQRDKRTDERTDGRTDGRTKRRVESLRPSVRLLDGVWHFVFQQDGAPAHRSRYTVAYLHCNNRKTGHGTVRILIRWIILCGVRCSRWCIVTKFQITLNSWSAFWLIAGLG